MKKISFFGKLLFCFTLLAMIAFPSGMTAQALPQEITNNPPYFAYLPYLTNPGTPVWLGPEGGTILSLAADPNPNNSNILYAGTSGAGVFKTIDAGATWTKANQNISDFIIHSLAIDPADSQVIYAGTHGQGVYKTVDGGKTWNPINSGIASTAVVYALAVNPGNNSLVYAGARVEGTSNGVLYKSVDRGGSWSAVFSQTGDWVYSLAVNPSSPNIILAATTFHGPYIANSYGGSGEWRAANVNSGDGTLGRAVAFDPRSGTNRAFFASSPNFFTSSDNGSNFKLSQNGISNTDIYPNGIAVKPGNPNVVYLATRSSYQGGVIKSANAGSSWTASGFPDKTVNSIVVPYGSGNSVFAGLSQDGLYKSTDGGANWGHSMAGIYNSEVTGLVFPGGATIYSSTFGSGVFKSTNGGVTWGEFNTNLTNKQVTSLLLNPANPNLMYAVTRGGLFKMDLSTTGGWASNPSLVTAPALAEAPAKGNQPDESQIDPYILGDAIDNMLNQVDQPVTPRSQSVAATNLISIGLNAMVFAPSNPKVAYLATNGNGVYRSSDGGVTFNPVGLAGQVVWKIAVSPTDPNLIYTATKTNGLVKQSTNGGSVWTALWLPNTTLVVNTVAMWGGGVNKMSVGTSSGVYVFDGAKWTAAGLQGYNINALTASPFDPSLMVAGTDKGAWQSTDGQDWISALPVSLNIQSINFNPADQTQIYFGSFDHGTLRMKVN